MLGTLTQFGNIRARGAIEATLCKALKLFKALERHFTSLLLLLLLLLLLYTLQVYKSVIKQQSVKIITKELQLH
jgi:hypothetical protein